MVLVKVFSWTRFLNIFQNQLCIIIIALLSVLGIPTLCVILSPMFVCRQIVKYLAPLFRPDLNKMVSYLGSACMNTDPEMHKTPRLAIISRYLFSQKMNFNDIIRTVEAEWLLAKDTDGTLLYPELQQYVTTWFGYRFWTQDKEFQIRNHITVIESVNNKIITEQDLRQISEKILSKSFPKFRSPWDIHIVYNVRLNQKSDSYDTAVFIRSSHSLADGYSLVKAYKRLFDVQESPKVVIKYPAMSLKEKIKFPFKVFYTFGELGMIAIKKYPFKVSEDKKVKNCYIQFANPIPSNVIKDIKNSLEFSFTSVVYGILTGAIRRMLIKSGTPVPDYLPSTIPLPKPGHPAQFRNHFVCVPIQFPVGESDPIRRLQLVHNQYDQLKFSAYPVVTDFLMMISGSSVDFVGKRIGENNLGVFVSSYMPMQYDKFSFNGHEGLELYGFCGVQKGSMGGSFGIIGSLGELSMSAAFDRGILSESDVLSFKNAVYDEFEHLKQICNVHV